MIIKIATGKDENGKVQWTHLYSAAIRNRLRRDLNLADVPDPAEARKNLGIEAYVAEVTEALEKNLKKYIDERDIYYHKYVMNYIKNNIETELEAHKGRLDNIEATMITKNTFDSYFQRSWDDTRRAPALRAELKAYSDANLKTAKDYSNENLGKAQIYTDGKISALDTALKAYITSQINPLNSRVGTLETLVINLSNTVNDLSTRVTNMISKLSINFTAISTDLDGIYNAAGTELSRLENEIRRTNDALKLMANVDERMAKILGDNSIATSADDNFFKDNTNEARNLLEKGVAAGSPPKQRTYRYQVTSIS